MHQKPVPYSGLFKYASYRDICLLFIGNLFIIYSSINIPLVNIVYGLMMRNMNDFVAQRANITTDASNTYPSPEQIHQTTDYTLKTTSQLNNITSTSIADKDSLANISSEFINSSYNLCMIVILFGITRFVALYLALLAYSVAAANQAKRVKLLFFKSLLKQEVAWFDLNRTGDFAIRITSDLSKFEEGIGEKIALCLNALFAWISSIISSFYYGWELTLACLVLVPLTVFITTLIAEFQATYALRETTALSHAFNVCHEVISSIRTVLSFSGQEKELNRFKNGLDNAYKFGVLRNVYAALNLGFTWMFGYLGFAICLLYSTKFYKPEYYGQYDEAHIITILWSAAGCVFLLNRMMPFIEVIQMARSSASNLFSVIERQSAIDVTKNEGLKLERLEANVKFENVSFTYPASGAKVYKHKKFVHHRNQTNQTGFKREFTPSNDEIKEEGSSSLISSSSTNSSSSNSVQSQAPKCRIVVTNLDENDRSETNSESPTDDTRSATLKNMSMEVKSGQTIALVGPSGSGKSTALALLQRFYEINQGSIQLDGHDIRSLHLGWLREQFGVVTQEPVLFDMSIADNIRLGALPNQSVSDYDIEQAARSANAHSFIAALPDGYQTRAGARGVQLSGGQKQRVAIARALIRQPKVLLLDEATSALDLESESVVQKALDQARIGRTTFIVAHRLSTVRNADKIIVFDKGTITEVGSHEELLHKRGLYYQIHAQQKRGIDLIPNVRRDSLILSAPSNVMGLPLNKILIQSDKLRDYARESRSMSIYSATGKFAAGATGHGGNVEGMYGGGDSAPDSNDGKFNDDDYYNGSPDEEEHDDDNNRDNTPSVKPIFLPLSSTPETSSTRCRSYSKSTVIETVPPPPTTLQMPKFPHNKVANEETQCSMLDLESVALINSKGRSITRLSLLSILKFIKPNIPYSIVGIFTSLLMGLCIPISAMIIGDIATIFSTDNPDEIRHGLYSHGLLYISLAIFAFFVSFVQVVSFGLSSEKIGIDLRTKGFKAIMARDISWFDNKRNNPGSICARLASDVGNVQSITGNRTAVIFQSISILVSTLVFAVYFNLKFSSVCVGFVAILLISTTLQARYAGKMALANRNFDSQIGKIVLESSANIKTVISLHQEEYFIRRCEELLSKDQRSRGLDNHLRLSLESLKYAMTAVSKGSSFYFAAHMLVNNEIQIDDIFKLIEIILYGLTEASKSLIFLSDLEKARKGTQNLYKLIYNNSQPTEGILRKSMKCKSERLKRPIFTVPNVLKRSADFLESKGYKRLKNKESGVTKICENLICEKDEPSPSGRISGNITFNRVRFHYPSRPEASILDNLDLKIDAGKSVALVGRSGCGKSTIIQLLQKFYENFYGRIEVDGVDLKLLPAEWMRQQIALVSQEPSLLSYSIGDNIRYGDNSRDVKFDEVVQAAKTANIHDFIMNLPNGYDTMLSESNSLQLSGGQKQRIAIARALVRRAPILIFDEATSALDSKSEHVVQEALQKAQLGKTSIIVAHRLSTIKNVDCVMVLRGGIVVEQGSHSELMEKRGEYFRLYKTQTKS